MLCFAPDGLITADLGNIKETHFMCRAQFLQHYANDRMRGRFRVVRNETDVHLIVRPQPLSSVTSAAVASPTVPGTCAISSAKRGSRRQSMPKGMRNSMQIVFFMSCAKPGGQASSSTGYLPSGLLHGAPRDEVA